MNPDTTTYIYLHTALASVLDVVFSDYRDDYRFIPPNSLITNNYSNLFNTYRNIQNSPKNKNGIDQLKLTNLCFFPSLSDQFSDSIILWRKLKPDVLNEVQSIKIQYQNILEVPDDLKVQVYELNKYLVEYKAFKAEFLDQGRIRIDRNRGELVINGQVYGVDVNSKPILFLDFLIAKGGIVAEYKDIAKQLDLNAYREGDTNFDVKREIQEVKRTLIDKLKVLKVPTKEINVISKKIVSARQRGYRFLNSQ